jgi:hypothetical protein
VSHEISHIFICFSSKDEAVAREVAQFLEAEGLKCWFSSRDVSGGQNYQETIVNAIENASGMVFLFSTNSSASGEVRKELSLAGSVNAPVFPLRLSPITPSGALRYELSTRQWIDMFPDREQALLKLVEAVRNALDSRASHERDPAETDAIATAPPGIVARAAATAASQANQRVQVPQAPVVAVGSQEFESIRALLAHHVGPIAKILIERTAAKALTRDDLCEQLAAHVKAPSDRAAFVQAARARLAIKS